VLEPGTVVAAVAVLGGIEGGIDGGIEGGTVGGRLVCEPEDRRDDSAAASGFPPRSSEESARAPSPHTPSTSATAPAPKASMRRRWYTNAGRRPLGGSVTRLTVIT
jgi:hypothetical protein